MSCCKDCILQRVLQAIPSVQSSFFLFPSSIKKHMLSLFTDFFFFFFFPMETFLQSHNTICVSVISSNSGLIFTLFIECNYFFRLSSGSDILYLLSAHCKRAANPKHVWFSSLMRVALWYLNLQWQLAVISLPKPCGKLTSDGTFMWYKQIIKPGDSCIIPWYMGCILRKWTGWSI